MNAATTPFVFGGARQKADVIPFSRATPRRFRRDADASDTPLGQILLFTGVRYERMPEPQTAAPLPQRRRS